MNITFAPEAWEDNHYWQKTDKRITKRVQELIMDIKRSPFEGIGKPEALQPSSLKLRRVTRSLPSDSD